MHILSMIQHRDKAPTNALIAQAVRSCAERRIPCLWYGNFFHGRTQRDSLADFKRHNGFQKVDLPRYYVALTAAGRMALRLGLHHTRTDWIPTPAATYRRIWQVVVYEKILRSGERVAESLAGMPRPKSPGSSTGTICSPRAPRVWR